MRAIQKEKEESEIISLVKSVRGGIASAGGVAIAYIEQGKLESIKCLGLYNLVADYVGIFCREAKKKRLPLDRKSIEEQYSHIDNMRQLPFFECLGELCDENYRVAMLLADILTRPGVLKSDSGDREWCMEQWRMLFFPGPIAVD